jgi:hypothetical protein
MKNKIDVVKVVSITGTVLGLAATLLTGWSQQKNLEKNIAEKVSEIANNK